MNGVGFVRHDNTSLTPAENIRNIASNKVLSDINAGIHKAAENGAMHFDYPLGMDICDCEVGYITKLVKKSGYHVSYYDNFNNDISDNITGPFIRVYWHE